MLCKACHKADGNPQTIGLISRTLRTAIPSKFTSTLEDILNNLNRLDRRNVARHLVASSIEGLNATERSLLASVSAIETPWTIDDAASIADLPTKTASETIGQLVDLGLIVSAEVALGKARYRLAGFVHELAKASVTTSESIDRHRDHFIAMVCDAIRQQAGNRQGVSLDTLDHYHLDVVKAFRSTIALDPGHPHTFVQAMVSSWWYWYHRNRTSEAISLIQTAIKSMPDRSHVDAARLMNINGVLLTKSGKANQAITHLRKSLRLAKLNSHERLSGSVLTNIADAFWTLNRPEQAVPCYRRAIEIWQNLSEPQNRAKAQVSAVPSFLEVGKVGEAQSLIEAATFVLERSAENLDAWTLAVAQAQVSLRLGRFSDTEEQLTRARDAALRLGDPAAQARTYLWLAQLDADRGRYLDAAEHIGAMKAIGASNVIQMYQTNELRAARIEGLVRAKLPPQQFLEASLSGQLRSIFDYQSY